LPMKRLYLVPIIHTGPDMGSIAPALDRIGSKTVGKEAWGRHLETVSRFWDSIEDFFENLELPAVKIFQDGMVADGEKALKIVDEGERAGSRNYRIISSLLRKGAALIKTEDMALVMSEHSYIVKIAEAKSPRESQTAARNYRLAERKLLEARDNFIARAITGALHEGETGILFIGGYHNIMSKLPMEIEIIQVKDSARVREYHALLTRPDHRREDSHFRHLAEYLVSPVSIK
jgi:hypothetical protein